MSDQTASGVDQRIFAIAMMVGAVWSFSGIEAMGKILVADLPVAMILWARLAFFLIFVSFLIRPGRWAHLLVTARPGLQIARALMPVTASVFSHIAFKTMSLADVTALTFASPFFLTALSVLILGERVGLHRWTAVAIGFVGVMIIIRPGSGVFGWVALLPLASAFFYGCFQMTTRYLSSSAAPDTTLLYTGIVGFAALSLIVPFTWQTPDLLQLGLLAMSGVLHVGSHYLLILAYARAPAAVLSPFNFTKMLGALLFGYLIFSELPDFYSIAGTIVIIAAGLYMLFREWLVARDG